MKKMIILAMAVLLLGLAGPASATTLGHYYLYADFTSSDGFLGGYDVDSYGDYLYVNNGNKVDRYTLTTAAPTDPTAQDVNTHPDNKGLDGQWGVAGIDDDVNGTTDDISEKNWSGSDDNAGPMLDRTLKYDTTFKIPAIGEQGTSEIFATADKIYFASDSETIMSYDLTTGALATETSRLGSGYGWGHGISHIARDSSGKWYASNESNDVYTYNGSSWKYLFTHSIHPAAYNHLDGLEIVSLDTDNDGTLDGEFLFTADMRADYLDRYALDGTLLESYSYTSTQMPLEGLGFGANNHFWATSGDHLYELGGGALAGADDEPCCTPEPSTVLLMLLGLVGLAGFRKKFSGR